MCLKALYDFAIAAAVVVAGEVEVELEVELKLESKLESVSSSATEIYVHCKCQTIATHKCTHTHTHAHGETMQCVCNLCLGIFNFLKLYTNAQWCKSARYACESEGAQLLAGAKYTKSLDASTIPSCNCVRNRLKTVCLQLNVSVYSARKPLCKDFAYVHPAQEGK